MIGTIAALIHEPTPLPITPDKAVLRAAPDWIRCHSYFRKAIAAQRIRGGANTLSRGDRFRCARWKSRSRFSISIICLH
jgi:hypothetical protein